MTPTDPTEETRPGGWVEGIGWVAPDTAMLPGDEARVFGIHPFTMSEVVWARLAASGREPAICVITRWRDGAEPAPPTPMDRWAALRNLPEYRALVASWAVYDPDDDEDEPLDLDDDEYDHAAEARRFIVGCVADLIALVAAVEHPEPIDDTPHPGTEGRT